MAEFMCDGKRVYYETYGQGEPLLLLNGIMMSCNSWKEFIEPLSQQNLLILVDMFDQGKSAKLEGSYDHFVQIELVNALLEHLDLKSVCMAGISYGSEIALEYAILYPEKVKRLMLFNATAATGFWLNDVGRAWNLAAGDPLRYYYTAIPVVYSPDFYKSHSEWMENRRRLLTNGAFANREFMDAMIRLTDSSSSYDVRERLGEILCPTLIVSCGQDYLTPVAEQKYLAEHIKNSHYLVFENCGHASMYEQPLLFASLILGFTNIIKDVYSVT